MSFNEGLQTYFANNSLHFGVVDVLCMGRYSVPGQVIDVLKQLLRFTDQSSRSPIRRFVVVVTPESAARYGGLSNVQVQLNEFIRSTGRNEPLDREPGDWLQVVAPADLRVESVLSIARALGPRTAFLVTNSSIFRGAKIDPEGESSSRFTLFEDFWVPHLTGLARQLLDVAKANETYGALIAGELSPRRPKLAALLQSIEGVGVVGATIENDFESVLARQEARLDADVADGRIGAALETIDALPSSMDADKPFLKIQMLHRAGLHGHALEMIEQNVRLDDVIDPFARTKLARVAYDAGSRQLAVRLLRGAVSELTTREALELAMATADDIDDAELLGQAMARIEERFPDSTLLARLRVRRAVADQRFQEASNLLSVTGGNASGAGVFAELGRKLGVPGVPDYTAILDQLALQYPDYQTQLRGYLVQDALKRELPLHAFALALRYTSQSPSDVDLLVEVLEHAVLERGPSGELPLSPDQLREAVLTVIRFLAVHPDEGNFRLRVARLLSVGVLGDLGLPLVVLSGLDGIGRPLDLFNVPSVNAISAGDLVKQKDFLRKAFEWLEAEGSFIMGRAKLPESLLPCEADRLLPAIEHLVLYMGETLSNDNDVKVMMNWLTLGTCVAPHSKHPDRDLPLVRLVAGRLVAAGRTQLARDLVEQTLQSSGASPARARVAWSIMADTYLRIGNTLEGLLALAAAAWGDLNVEDEQAWHEAFTMARGLRDIGMTREARRAVNTVERIASHMGHGELNKHRVELLALTIDMRELLEKGSPQPDDIVSLLAKITKNANTVLERNDEPTPVALLLGQIIRSANEAGVPVPQESTKAYSALLKDVGTSTVDLLQAAAAVHPTADEVFKAYVRTERARYSDDVAYDNRGTVLATRRMLSADTVLGDSDAVAFGVEVLSDRAIAIPGWEVTAKPVSPLSEIGQASDMAKSISRQGVSVVLAAFDSQRSMLRIEARAGEMRSPIREGQETFSEPRFQKWKKSFPYDYGRDDADPNAFYVSTEGIAISDPLPNEPVVLVMDTQLQMLPPNLIRHGDGFAGERTPIASSPSLSWLNQARVAPAETDGRRVAWISTDESQGHTLAMIAARLKGSFEDYGFSLATGPSLPDNFAGVDIAVIAAHGSLEPDEQFFQRISDEGKTRLSISALASGLRNVGIVVLFVCSAGRNDRHPAAETNIGLTKEILDRGCSTVIASPWPLDARVTYHWLPTFLAELEGGASAVHANFVANGAVAQELGNDLKTRLAMNVFGDPLRTVTRKL